MVHALKTEPLFFEASAAGVKEFEVRKNDRPFQPDDFVALNEWSGEKYTGRCMLKKIIYILVDPQYCKDGYVILGLEPCKITARSDHRENPFMFDRGTPVYER